MEVRVWCALETSVGAVTTMEYALCATICTTWTKLPLSLASLAAPLTPTASIVYPVHPPALTANLAICSLEIHVWTRLLSPATSIIAEFVKPTTTLDARSAMTGTRSRLMAPAPKPPVLES